jgi:hypothetical protein
LEYLLLNNNSLIGWKIVEGLFAINQLRVLTLQGNPCSKMVGYRKFMIDSKKSLYALDEMVIQDFERKEYVNLFPKSAFKADRLNQLKRFRPHNPETGRFVSMGPP